MAARRWVIVVKPVAMGKAVKIPHVERVIVIFSVFVLKLPFLWR